MTINMVSAKNLRFKAFWCIFYILYLHYICFYLRTNLRINLGIYLSLSVYTRYNNTIYFDNFNNAVTAAYYWILKKYFSSHIFLPSAISNKYSIPIKTRGIPASDVTSSVCWARAGVRSVRGRRGGRGGGGSGGGGGNWLRWRISEVFVATV